MIFEILRCWPIILVAAVKKEMSNVTVVLEKLLPSLPRFPSPFSACHDSSSTCRAGAYLAVSQWRH